MLFLSFQACRLSAEETQVFWGHSNPTWKENEIFALTGDGMVAPSRSSHLVELTLTSFLSLSLSLIPSLERLIRPLLKVLSLIIIAENTSTRETETDTFYFNQTTLVGQLSLDLSLTILLRKRSRYIYCKYTIKGLAISYNVCIMFCC